MPNSKEISQAMSQLAKFRWKNTPKWKRKLHSKAMHAARKAKKLLTQETLRKHGIEI